MNEPITSDAEPIAWITFKLRDSEDNIEFTYQGDEGQIIHMLTAAFRVDEDFYAIAEKARTLFLAYQNRKNN